MAEMILKNNRKISSEEKPYIIAELNSSHNGSVELAKRMIDAAKDCGCDCVKFQSWSEETLYSDEWRDANAISTRIFKKVSLSETQLSELAEYCASMRIDFSSTPYSEDEVDFLADKAGAPYIKVASMEIDNHPFLKYIGNKGVPIIISTGMSEIEEIRDAVRVIEATGNRNLCILHCVSVYPAPADVINLNNIRMLQEEFRDYPIGYSDHTIGFEIAAASVAMGAAVIEKHFTLDNAKMGMDNSMATEPKTMKELVRACYNVHEAMGNYKRCVLDDEKEQIKKMRRSIISTREIEAGHILEAADLTAKRPGDGISPSRINQIIGKTVINDIKKGYKISENNLK